MIERIHGPIKKYGDLEFEELTGDQAKINEIIDYLNERDLLKQNEENLSELQKRD